VAAVSNFLEAESFEWGIARDGSGNRSQQLGKSFPSSPLSILTLPKASYLLKISSTKGTGQKMKRLTGVTLFPRHPSPRCSPRCFSLHPVSMLTRCVEFCCVYGRVSKGSAGLGRADGHGAVGSWSHSVGERFVYMVSSGLLVSSPCLFTDYLSQTRTRRYTRPVASTRIVPLASSMIRAAYLAPACNNPNDYSRYPEIYRSQ